MLSVNPIIGTDSYKVSHYKQYPPGTAHVFSYFESRGFSDKFKEMHALACPDSINTHYQHATVFFGALQYYLATKLQRITRAHIEEAKDVFQSHFGTLDFFNEEGWRRIVQKHDGALPIRIRAVPEGTRVPVSHALVTVENLDAELPWLTNYLETRLSNMWYPITVATLSYYCKRIMQKWLAKTGDESVLDFMLHDFGYRGVSSEESAAIGGLAHLVNFKGTDTMAALMMGRSYYQSPSAGFSIPAAEHSTITSWGRENEVVAFDNMLRQYPKGLVAVVSDSYDIYAACDKLWGETLRDQVMTREGRLVIRPDSGDPVDVLPRVLNILGNKFGTTLNAKGYKVLHPNVRVIQGDGVNPASIDAILSRIAQDGWSAENLAFGMGGGLLQQVNRDDCKFAFKCSAITIGTGWNAFDRDVYKDPITDPGKTSKRGRLSLYQSGGYFFTSEAGGLREADEIMKTVYEDGFILINDSLETIRNRAALRPLGVAAGY